MVPADRGERMRVFWIAVSIFLAGCDSPAAEQADGQSAPAAFEGALVRNASAHIAHGERIADVLGCRGCHGADLQGRKFDDDPSGYGVLWAPNLTRSMATMSDSQFEALMRRGIHPERPKLWVMPSENFQHLSKDDMRALRLYLRSFPPSGQPSPPPLLGPRAIAEEAEGKVKPAAVLVRETASVLPADVGRAHARGRYIAAVACGECHGAALEGREGDTPNLDIVGAYSAEQFATLMRTGAPVGGRDLGLMAQVARSRFTKLTDREVAELYAYLHARALRPQ
jgi:cytochrome c553